MKNSPMPIILNVLSKSISTMKNETYFRTVYLWAEGLLDSKQGRVKEGQKKMEDAVYIFEMLGCDKSAEYYRKTPDCWISAN